MGDFYEQLAWGEEGERLVAAKLIDSGVSVAPLYQFKNHNASPFLLTTTEKLILPDLTCWFNGSNYFAECKRKNQWVNFNGRVETGLDSRHFEHYKKVKDITGRKIYLFFLHEKEAPTGLFYREISKLEPHKRFWDGNAPNGKRISKPLVLFPINQLKMAVYEVAA